MTIWNVVCWVAGFMMGAVTLSAYACLYVGAQAASTPTGPRSSGSWSWRRSGKQREGT